MWGHTLLQYETPHNDEEASPQAVDPRSKRLQRLRQVPEAGWTGCNGGVGPKHPPHSPNSSFSLISIHHIVSIAMVRHQNIVVSIHPTRHSLSSSAFISGEGKEEIIWPNVCCVQLVIILFAEKPVKSWIGGCNVLLCQNTTRQSYKSPEMCARPAHPW